MVVIIIGDCAGEVFCFVFERQNKESNKKLYNGAELAKSSLVNRHVIYMASPSLATEEDMGEGSNVLDFLFLQQFVCRETMSKRNDWNGQRSSLTHFT